MSKINAFTLMEVTIAMLLSAICISVCYSAYGIIENYYDQFQRRNQSTDQILSLKHIMEKDFLNSRYVLKTDSGMIIEKDSAVIQYTLHPDYILRDLSGQHIDKFSLQLYSSDFFFENVPVLGRDTIDKLELDLQMKKDGRIRLRLDKRYSAKDLFN